MPDNIKFSRFVDLLLARLYEYEQEFGAGRYFDLRTIAQEFKFDTPRQWIFDAAKILESRGWIQAIFTFGGMCRASLTGEGRLFVEFEESDAIKDYNANKGIYVHVSGDSNQVIVGGGDQTNIDQNSSIEQQREPAFEAINEIKNALRHDNTLSSKEKDDLLIDVETVENQLKKRRPNSHVIESVLEPMKNIMSLAGTVRNLIDLLIL